MKLTLKSLELKQIKYFLKAQKILNKMNSTLTEVRDPTHRSKSKKALSLHLFILTDL